MMPDTAPSARAAPLAERLPPLAGRVQADAPLAPHTWFRVGGPAEALVRPADAADLAAFLRALPPDVPAPPTATPPRSSCFMPSEIRSFSTSTSSTIALTLSPL